MIKIVTALLVTFAITTSSLAAELVTSSADGDKGWFAYPETLTRAKNGFMIGFGIRSKDNVEQRVVISIEDTTCVRKSGPLYAFKEGGILDDNIAAGPTWQIVAQVAIENPKTVSDYISKWTCILINEKRSDKKPKLPPVRDGEVLKMT